MDTKKKSGAPSRSSGVIKALRGGKKDRSETRERLRLAVLTADRETVKSVLAGDDMKVLKGKTKEQRKNLFFIFYLLPSPFFFFFFLCVLFCLSYPVDLMCVCFVSKDSERA